MSNIIRYNRVFQTIFNTETENFNSDFATETISEWDSITHLSLITALEDEFDIMFDAADILSFKSYDEGKEIVAKYGIEFNS